MGTSLEQRNFAAGELSPSLYARADTQKYQSGLRTCRNFTVERFGGVSNRPGTGFVAQTKIPGQPVRLLRFIFSTTQAYVLEFGVGYMRIIANGALVNVSGVVAWSSVTAYALGQVASLAGVNYVCIQANTNNSPPNGAYWYALTGTIYEIPTPYGATDLPNLRYVQSADVVTITHPLYPIQQLARYGLTQWALTPWTFGPKTAAPATVNVTPGVSPGSGLTAPAGLALSGGQAYAGPAFNYQVSAYATSGTPGVSEGPACAIVTQGVNIAAAPGHAITLTWSAVANANGYCIYRNGFLIGIVSPSTLTFADDNSMYQAVPIRVAPSTGLGTVQSWDYKVSAIDATSGVESLPTEGVATGQSPTSNNPNVVSWTAVPGAGSYNIYRLSNGVYGFVGSSVGTSFSDPPPASTVTGPITPNVATQPVTSPNPFVGAGNYPSTCAYTQQRLGFAATINQPETAWLTLVGDYHNLGVHTPLLASDAVQFTLASRQVNPIQHMVEITNLVILSSAGEFSVQGDGNGVISPTAINLHQQGYSGSTGLAPIVIENTFLYVQARGTFVKDLRYDLVSNGYTGRDLTIYSSHLFQTYSLVDWDYAQVPQSVIWAVRDDGVLLGLTYLRNQEIWGWSHHDTQGQFLNVCSIPEAQQYATKTGQEDVTYVVAQRVVAGSTVQYIERFFSRTFQNIAIDAHFLDCESTFNGTNASGTTLSLATVTGGWTSLDTLTLVASSGTFAASNVGDWYLLTGPSGGLVTVTVKAYTDAQHVTVVAQANVPTDLHGAATAIWSHAAITIAGLSYLQGASVMVLADGNVQGPFTVTGGQITLSTPAVVVHVGLGYVADFETLNLDVANQETLFDKKKIVAKCTLVVEASRNFLVGTDSSNLNEAQPSYAAVGGGPLAPFTGNVEVLCSGTWDYNGRVFVRQDKPLPISIRACIPHGEIGGT